MDGFTFITEILKALVWPITVITLVSLLRKPVIELVPLMKKLKYKELELEFAQEIQNLKSQTEDALPKTTEQKNSESQHSKAFDLISFSTRAAIIEAWLELEAAAIEIASSFWNQEPSDIFKNSQRLGEYLHQCKVLDDKQFLIYKKLQQLRNQSAHEANLNLNENDVKAYIEMANNLAMHIKSF